MRYTVKYGITATGQGMTAALGRRAARYVPNPTIDRYLAVVMFPDNEVIPSNEIGRMLRKTQIGPPFLVSAYSLTVEAQKAVTEAGGDVLESKQFYSTDESFAHGRRR